MNTSENNDQILKFFEKIEPIVIFFNKLDENELVGLIFFIIIIAGFFACWFWVIFKNGAQVWQDRIIKLHKKYGLPVVPILVSKIALKVSLTIMLLFMISGLLAVILSMRS